MKLVRAVVIVSVGAAIVLSFMYWRFRHSPPPEFKTLSIYCVDGFDGWKLHPDDLVGVPRVKVDPSTIDDLFANSVRRLPVLVWQGTFLGIGQESQGRQRRLRISMYGTYVNIEGCRGTFKLAGKSRIQMEQVVNLTVRKGARCRYGPRKLTEAAGDSPSEEEPTTGD